MTESAAAPSKPRAKQGKTPLTLHVVFDTNVLFTHSASDLVHPQVVDLLKTPVKDLNVMWYLPSVVRHERQYQMQTKALEVLPAVEKLERLLRHPLNISRDLVLYQVNEAVERQMKDLQLRELEVNPNDVDWVRMMLDASYRRPPFQVGDKEKGFRDALIAEAFLQIVVSLPATPKTCRIIFLTDDVLLRTAVEGRLPPDRKNAKVLPNTDELRNLLSVLASEVTEDFIAPYRNRAKELFFRENDQESLYVKENVGAAIRSQFQELLKKPPNDATSRKNIQWYISSPSFVAKKQQRVTWSSRIKVTAEAYKLLPDQSSSASLRDAIAAPVKPFRIFPSLPRVANTASEVSIPYGKYILFTPGASTTRPTDSGLELRRNWSLGTPPSIQRDRYETVGKGFDTFDVIWSITISTGGNLVSAKIDDIVHVETYWDVPS